MLESYRKNFMTNNRYINLFDIIIALVLARVIWDWPVSFIWKAPVLILLCARAGLNIICMTYNGHRRLGIGSISLLFVALSVIWSSDFKHSTCIGDTVLKSIGLPIWTNGDTGFHLTIFYGIIFLIPALILSLKYPDHLFSKFSTVVSWMGILMSASLLIVLAFL